MVCDGSPPLVGHRHALNAMAQKRYRTFCQLLLNIDYNYFLTPWPEVCDVLIANLHLSYRFYPCAPICSSQQSPTCPWSFPQLSPTSLSLYPHVSCLGLCLSVPVPVPVPVPRLSCRPPPCSPFDLNPCTACRGIDRHALVHTQACCLPDLSIDPQTCLRSSIYIFLYFLFIDTSLRMNLVF